MEKKSFIGLLFIMAILFLYPFYVAKISPPPPSLPKEIRKTTELISPENNQKARNFESESPIKGSDTVHDTVITNARLQVTLTNQGAGIKMIRLIRFKDPNKKDNLMLCNSKSYSKNLFVWAEPFLGYDLSQANFEYVEQKNRINYSLTLPSGIKIEKDFLLEENSDLIKITIRIRNSQDKPLPSAFSLIAAGNLVKNEPFEERYLEVAAVGTSDKIQHDFLRQIKNFKEYISPVSWLALKNKYFCQVITPLSSKISFQAQRIENNSLEVRCQIPLSIIAPQETREEKFIFYAGPLDSGLLSRYNPEWDKVVYYGTFDGIAKFILRILKTGFLFFKNYGLAIIFLSFLVNVVLFPFTWKSLKSMQRMQALQPQMDRLRKEHGQDPQKLNKEMLELYRKNKVNPFGGCLPMILQMPIFFALFQGLSRAIELKGTHFLWIKDLAGSRETLLTLLMVLGIYLQQKKSQGLAQASQKQMLWFTPVLMGLVFYNSPAGLVLYWTTSTFLSMGLQSLFTGRSPTQQTGQTS